MAEAQTKICQNCQQKFIIEPEDFEFYEKIKVPAPTFCPECRIQRRMTWRNEASLYKRKNDFSEENIISAISSDKSFKVYDYKTWWSDKWDPMDYGMDYDFFRPFFRQFRELLEKVPMLALFDGHSVNSEYCQHAANNKSCYLVSASLGNENMTYSNRVWECTDSSDIYIGNKLQLCYEIFNCYNCYCLFYSRNCRNCNDSFFLFDCANCNDCFGCVNLRNKAYYIFNKPHSKEEYKRKIQEFNLGDYKKVLEMKEKFQEIFKTALHKYANLKKTVNVIGDNIEEGKNSQFCFDLFGLVEDSKFLWWGGANCKDSYDGGPGIGDRSELLYEGVDNGIQSSRTKFSVVVWGCHNTYYCFNCHSCSYLFGCIGLRHKEYCILNKQYIKEEYEKLVPKIIEHMNEMPYVSKHQIQNSGVTHY
ncbi:hypothetical protein HY750_01710 [Candidatus Kuenenbacteria bacterium]|nr:hypothetical protein [Candidatus Kuenenbacteria bacterium]